MRTDFQLRGFKELERALAEDMPRATAKNTMRRTATNVMKRIEDGMRQRVPVDKGEIRDSIATKPVKAKRVSRTRFASSGSIEVATGPTSRKADDPGGNPAWQELGTVNMPANAYARPTADAEAENVINDTRDELALQVRKTKDRIARKLARGK